jgi:hypothetical protein
MLLEIGELLLWSGQVSLSAASIISWGRIRASLLFEAWGGCPKGKSLSKVKRRPTSTRRKTGLLELPCLQLLRYYLGARTVKINPNQSLLLTSQAHLETVHKLWVLSVCEIVELLACQRLVARLGLDLRLLLVLPPAPKVDEQDVNDADGPADDDSDLCRTILRCIFRLEDLRADDVADAVADQVPGNAR